MSRPIRAHVLRQFLNNQHNVGAQEAPKYVLSISMRTLLLVNFFLLEGKI